MTDTLKKLIVKCVTKNVVFNGSVGSVYTVQELFHAVSNLKSIDTMWARAKKELAALDGDTLFASKNQSKKADLRLKVDTLAEVFDYKQEQAKLAKERAELAQERAEKLEILKKIKTEKEFKKMGKLSLKELEAEIEKLNEA